jgi:hypothetical protein
VEENQKKKLILLEPLRYPEMMPYSFIPLFERDLSDKTDELTRRKNTYPFREIKYSWIPGLYILHSIKLLEAFLSRR